MIKNRKRIWIVGLFVLLVSGFLALAWYVPIKGGDMPAMELISQKDLFDSPPTITSPEELKDQLSTEPSLSVTPGIEETPFVSIISQSNTPIENVPKEVCGNTKPLTILVLGIDEMEQADAIRLVRVDFTGQSIQSLSIPRDFYLEIPDVAAYGIKKGRINAAYGYGEYFEGKDAGVRFVVNTLNYNFGVNFDEYLVVHLLTIEKYIDKVGGLDITLEKTVDGRKDGYQLWLAGPQHFDGKTAVEFMRTRYYDSDFARINRQSLILSALFDKAQNELSLIGWIDIGVSLLTDQQIKTSLSVDEGMSFICLTRLLTDSDIRFIEIPPEMFHGATTSAGGSVQIPYNTIVPFIQDFMTGKFQ